MEFRRVAKSIRRKFFAYELLAKLPELSSVSIACRCYKPSRSGFVNFPGQFHPKSVFSIYLARIIPRATSAHTR